MSTETATPPAAPPQLPAQQPQRLIVQDDSEISHLMDTARFDHLLRIARVMGGSALTPKHLKGGNAEETAANCFRVVNQALRWGFDPFAVADESYVVSGKLGWQGKLVASVVIKHAGIEGRPTYEYTGAGDSLKLKVSARFRGEAEPRSVEVELKKVRTSNKMWTEDPEQKLAYTGITKWARRHCPEVLMGILTDNDLELMRDRGDAIDTTATIRPVGGNDRLAALLEETREPGEDQ